MSRDYTYPDKMKSSLLDDESINEEAEVCEDVVCPRCGALVSEGEGLCTTCLILSTVTDLM